MKVVVCVKQGTVLGDELELPAGGREVDPALLEQAPDPWDAYTTEQALRVREDGDGGEVVAVTAGGERADEALRRALALGADRAVRVWSEALRDADPLTVARALAPVVRAEEPDLVLCGGLSSDAVQGATGTALAELLDLPLVAAVTRLELRGRTATVHREVEGGLVEAVEVDLPCLLTIQRGSNEPRHANLRALKRAEQQEIRVQAPGDLGAPAARVRRLYVPGDGERAELLTGDAAEIARRIKEIVDERLRA